MNVLYKLQNLERGSLNLLVRREGFSIELFGVQNSSTNTVLTASNVYAEILGSIPSIRSLLVSSASNIHVNLDV